MKVFAFGSGKGGVGKSLVSASVAVELASRGFRTGLLDLDLHGPTQHLLFPVEGRLEADRSGLKPFMAPSGVKVFSLGYLFRYEPLPIKEKYEMVSDLSWLVDWGEAEHLIVDMPPGTGDEHLAMLRSLKPSKVFLVSLPSEESISVVRRAYFLYRDEGYEPEGILLNMCWVECNGEKVYPFGRVEGGIGMPVLAELPLDPKIKRRPIEKGTGPYWREIERFVERYILQA